MYNHGEFELTHTTTDEGEMNMSKKELTPKERAGLGKLLAAIFKPDPPTRGCLSAEEFQGLLDETETDYEGNVYQSKIAHMAKCVTCQAEAIRLGIMRPSDFRD